MESEQQSHKKRRKRDQMIKDFLEINNLESMDDVPMCPICGIRKRKINLCTGGINKTCGDTKCAHTRYTEDGIPKTEEYYIKKFLEAHNLESLDDVPVCPACKTRKRKINLVHNIMYKTCCEPECRTLSRDGVLLTEDAYLERFLKTLGLNSLDDIPLCPICKTRKRRFNLQRRKIYSTCDDPECLAHSKFRMTRNEKIERTLNQYNLKSLDDVPICQVCGVRKRKVNIDGMYIHRTCGDPKCELEKKRNRLKTGEYRGDEFYLKRFLERHNLKSLDDIPKCPYCDKKVMYNIVRQHIFTTCNSKECYKKWQKEVRGPEISRMKKGKKSSMSAEKKSERARKINLTRLRRSQEDRNYKGLFNGGFSKVEQRCYEFLKENFDENLDSRFIIGDPETGKYRIYDMYSDLHNLIIEFDGDYWHSSEAAKENDRLKDELAHSYGYNIYRIKEHEFYESEQDVLMSLIDFCIQEGI